MIDFNKILAEGQEEIFSGSSKQSLLMFKSELLVLFLNNWTIACYSMDPEVCRHRTKRAKLGTHS